jgi:uncharacterized membrane protein
MNRLNDRLHIALQALDRRVGIMLRVGIIVSLALITIGIVHYAVKGGSPETALTTLSLIPAGLAQLDAAAFITAGLFIILLLPIVIIITSLAHFITMRERNPIIVCVILLAMLAVSFIFIVK